MKKINAFQFGFSFGLSGTIIYTIMVLLSLASENTIIKGINLLFHGFDFSSLVTDHKPLGLSDLLGAILVFSLLFLMGSITAGIYNYGLREEN